MNLSQTSHFNVAKILKNYYRYMHICCGIDFGYYTHKSCIVKHIVKFVNLFQCSVIIYFAFKIQRLTVGIHLFWYCMHLAKFLSYVLIFASRTENTTFASFERQLKVIDLKLKAFDVHRKVKTKELLSLVASFIFRIVCTFLYCLLFKLPWSYSICHVVILVHDVILIANSFVYYAMYQRLIIFATNLKANNRDLVSFHNLYKTIADLVENFKGAYDILIICTVMINVPEIMLTIYCALVDFQSRQLPIWQLFIRAENMSVLLNFTATLAPAVCAGILSGQTEKISLILHDIMLLEIDETKTVLIQRFIRYVEARPLKFMVFEVIPLNARLFFIIVSFSATYLIVILQFTHLV